MLFHFAVRGTPSHHWIDHAFLRMANVGWIGVDLFFVLSGFLITGILYDAKGSDHFLLNFWTRRVLRIFPLYFSFLAVRLLVLPPLLPHEPLLVVPPGTQIWLWTYTTNFAITLHGFGGVPPLTQHFWSLAIEEQFYFLWPLLVVRFDRAALLRMCGAAVVIATIVRVAVRFGLQSAAGPYMLMPARMDALAVGAFIALMVRGQDGVAVLRRHVRWVSVVSLVLLAGVLLQRGTWYAYGLPMQMVGFLPLACLSGALLFNALDAPSRLSARALRVAPLRLLGRYSYGLYVLHVPIMHVFMDHVIPTGHLPAVVGFLLPAQLAAVVAQTAVSSALAVASYHLLEERFLTLKRYFGPGHPA